MAYKKIEDFVKSPTVRMDRNGDGTESEFKLLATKQVPSKMYPDKMNTLYEVEYNGKDLPAIIEANKAEFPTFATDRKASVWGSPILDRKMEQASVGDQIKVVYLGKIPHTKKGYNPLASFDVFIDDGSEGSDESLATAEAAKKKLPF